jgi:hypothetical protein
LNFIYSGNTDMPNKLKIILFNVTVLFLLSALSANMQAARFFKWTDADGNVHYSDKAPDDIESAETIRINTRTPGGVSNTQAPQFETGRQEDARELSTEELAEKARQDKELAEYCNSIRSNIKALQIGGRIQTVDTEGERRFLDPSEQQQKLNEYQTLERENCK